MHWLAVLLYAALAALGAAWPQGTLSGSLPEPIATSPASAANASLIGDSNTQIYEIPDSDNSLLYFTQFPLTRLNIPSLKNCGNTKADLIFFKIEQGTPEGAIVPPTERYRFCNFNLVFGYVGYPYAPDTITWRELGLVFRGIATAADPPYNYNVQSRIEVYRDGSKISEAMIERQAAVEAE